MRRVNSDKIFDVVNVIIMLVFFLILVWPLWFVLIASISDPSELNAGKVLLWPVGFSLEGYQHILEYNVIWKGYFNTIINTVVGTTLNMIMSIMVAYPLSDKNFRLRGPVTVFLMITMYFSGGLIPHYLLYKQVGIINTRFVMFFPGLMSVYNSLIVRSYFQNSIPGELKEAATIDGANAAQYLVRVVMPLSKPVFAVVGLYFMVGHWNNYTNALYYIYEPDLYPLQSVLRRLLMSSKMIEDMMDLAIDTAELELMAKRASLMQYGVIIVAAIPVLCVYPFIQKYFVKGVMVGAVKG